MIGSGSAACATTDAHRTAVTPPQQFLRGCLQAKRSDDKPLVAGAILFNTSGQQLIAPNIATLAAVLDAVPLQPNDPLLGMTKVIFDAVTTFAGFSALDATSYMYNQYLNKTTGMPLMDPGYDYSSNATTPPLEGGKIATGLIDYIVKERIFNFFMLNQCTEGKPEHRMMELIATSNPWPRPLVVLGYNSEKADGFNGYEAETNCVSEHDMGAVSSSKVNNLAFFSRKPPISVPLLQSALDRSPFNASKTYLTMIIGDGDNVAKVKGPLREWFLRRQALCGPRTNDGDQKNCFPLVWTLAPHLVHMAPDWLLWFYRAAQTTGHDHFVLPPGGDMYSYPAMMRPGDQASLVRRNERDALLLNTSGVVEWEMYDTWRDAVRDYYPRYNHNAIVRGLFAVNVPYILPTGMFRPGEFYKIIGDTTADGSTTVLFKLREWRGARSSTVKANLFPANLAKEINAYPAGTVTAIYMTSDGGSANKSSTKLDQTYELAGLLHEHVQLVDQEHAAKFALEHHRRKQASMTQS